MLHKYTISNLKFFFKFIPFFLFYKASQALFRVAGYAQNTADCRRVQQLQVKFVFELF